MKNLTGKKIAGVILGNLILGIGVALLKVSQMGNDPYSACNMAISDVIGMWLGTYHKCCFIRNTAFVGQKIYWLWNSNQFVFAGLCRTVFSQRLGNNYWKR